MLKNNKAITLVALVITIIILLILAGITIATLTNSGLFDKAKTAQEQYQNAQDYEKIEIGKYSNEIESYTIGNRSMTNIEKMMYPNLWENGVEQEFENGVYGIRKEGNVSGTGATSETLIDLGQNFSISGIINAGGYFTTSDGPEGLYYCGRSGIWSKNGSIYLGNSYNSNTHFNIWVLYTKTMVQN